MGRLVLTMGRVQHALLWPVLLGVVYVWLYASFASGYFFLFDDFALIGTVETTSWQDILTSALFGFYRPALFLVTKVVFVWAGWTYPAAYAFVFSLVHFANSLLVFSLALRCRVPRVGGALAGLLFLLAPWSSEASFWVSGSFDVLSAAGVLVALHGTLGLADKATISRIGWATAGIGGALLATLSKETAVTLPCLIALTMWLRGESLRSIVGLRTIAYLGGVSGVVGLYLLLRSQMLPGLSGAYGEARDLFAGAPLLKNYGLYWYAVARPVGLGEPLGMLSLYSFTYAAVPVLAVRLVRTSPRVAVAGVSLFTVTVLPSLWMPPDIEVTNQRRLMYMPTIWIAVMIGTAVGGWWQATSSRMAAFARTVITAVVLSTAFASAAYQRHLWQNAARVSELVIRQLEPVTRISDPVRLQDYPTRCAEGPRIHQNYAAERYYGADRVPPLHIEAVVITCTAPIGLVRQQAPESVRQYDDVQALREVVIAIDSSLLR